MAKTAIFDEVLELCLLACRHCSGNSHGTRTVIGRALRTRVEAELGQPIASATRVSGGDINQAFELGLADGRSVFLKSNAHAPLTMFAAEARVWRFWSKPARCARRTCWLCPMLAKALAFLLLEFIRSRAARPSFDDELGRGLARLHGAGPAGFGFGEPNFIGRLSQSNGEQPTWAEFYRAERLEPQLRLAIEGGRAPSTLARDFERLFSQACRAGRRTGAPRTLTWRSVGRQSARRTSRARRV